MTTIRGWPISTSTKLAFSLLQVQQLSKHGSRVPTDSSSICVLLNLLQVHGTGRGGMELELELELEMELELELELKWGWNGVGVERPI